MYVEDDRRTRLDELRRQWADLKAVKDDLLVQFKEISAKIARKEEEMSTLAPVYILPEDVVAGVARGGPALHEGGENEG